MCCSMDPDNKKCANVPLFPLLQVQPLPDNTGETQCFMLEIPALTGTKPVAGLFFFKGWMWSSFVANSKVLVWYMSYVDSCLRASTSWPWLYLWIYRCHLLSFLFTAAGASWASDDTSDTRSTRLAVMLRSTTSHSSAHVVSGAVTEIEGARRCPHQTRCCLAWFYPSIKWEQRSFLLKHITV